VERNQKREVENFRFPAKFLHAHRLDNLVFIQTAIPAAKKPAAMINVAPQFVAFNNHHPGRPTTAASDGQPPRRRPGGGGPASGGPAAVDRASRWRPGCGRSDANRISSLSSRLTARRGKPRGRNVTRKKFHTKGPSPAMERLRPRRRLPTARTSSRISARADCIARLQRQREMAKGPRQSTHLEFFGEGSSPALFGNTIVVNWDHQGDDFIVAFDKKTATNCGGRNAKRYELEHAADRPARSAAQVIVDASSKCQL